MNDFAEEIARILGLSVEDDSLDGGIEGAVHGLLAERDLYEARVRQGEKTIVSDALRQLLLSQVGTLGRENATPAPGSATATTSRDD